MNDDALAKVRVTIAADYFRYVDNGDPRLPDLMTDDVEIYFPKFGTSKGKEALAEAARGLMASLLSLAHDMESMKYHVAGNHVITEGFESGVTKDGIAWPIAGRSEGRFCNVFEFEGELIKRLFVYVDPDFASTHGERFLWGDRIRTLEE
nr:nuclear transport factor 2 family protein [Marinicella sp. W31]MDC2876106.1 nuclear transport factor 2 family protein [Marinicella sp. W31]